jgi:hypothetical protein
MENQVENKPVHTQAYTLLYRHKRHTNSTGNYTRSIENNWLRLSQIAEKACQFSAAASSLHVTDFHDREKIIKHSRAT